MYVLSDNSEFIHMAGVISNDRKQGARVRRLLLDEVERLFTTDPLKLSETEHQTKKELLLRMAPNTLPRLTEVTGEDGAALVIQIAKEVADRNSINDTNPVSGNDSEGPSSL